MESEVPATAAATGLLLKEDNATCYLWLQAEGPGPHIHLDPTFVPSLSPFKTFHYRVNCLSAATVDRRGGKWSRLH